MLGLFDWLFGKKDVQDVVQEVKFVVNYMITEPDGVYDGYAVVKGERISLYEVNPPVITFLKILMRDFKKVKVKSMSKYGYVGMPTQFFAVTFGDITAETCYNRSFREKGTWDVIYNSLGVNLTNTESQLLCIVYRKLVKCREDRSAQLKKLRKERLQNKQRKEIDKMLREKYNV